MTIRIPEAGQNAGADAIVDRADSGSGPAILEIRAGAQPATANDVASGTLLATFTLLDPAFLPAADEDAEADPGQKWLNVDPEDLPTATGAAEGAAGWARVKDSDGATVIDGSVSASGGGGDFIISTTAVSTGLTLRLVSGYMTMPSGA